MLNFETLNLKEEILKAIQDMGFTEATPIQEQAIPVALTGQDVIGQAQTGTGKTAAFTIPFLQLLGNEPAVQVLILTPTRELCMQVEKEVKKLSKYQPQNHPSGPSENDRTGRSRRNAEYGLFRRH